MNNKNIKGVRLIVAAIVLFFIVFRHHPHLL